MPAATPPNPPDAATAPPPPPPVRAPLPAPAGQQSFFLVVGIAVLLLPLLAMAVGGGVYLYSQTGAIGDSFERVQRAEAEAAARLERQRAERQRQATADFQAAMTAQEWAKADRILQQMAADEVSDVDLAPLREALESARPPQADDTERAGDAEK